MITFPQAVHEEKYIIKCPSGLVEYYGCRKEIS
jgi:hypothetical protein